MPDPVIIKKALEWDKVGERFYETGVDKGVLYPQADDGTYPSGVAWNGLTKVNENPTGAESTKIYANNGTYLNLKSAEECEGTIGAYTYPDEFEECDGSKKVGPGFAIKQQRRRPFGLTYRTLIGNDTEGDEKGYIIHIVYGATAKPSGKEHNTINESPEALEFSWDFDTVPVKSNKTIDGKALKPTASLEFKTTDENIPEGFITALEEKLYGKDGVEGAAIEPHLPSIDEIIDLYLQMQGE